MPTAPQLVRTPQGSLQTSEWLHQVMVSLLLRGNCYGVRVRPTSLNVSTQAIHLLNPDSVTPKTRDDGTMVYAVGPKRIEYDETEIWHVRGLTMPGSQVGLSPIAYAAATLGVDLQSRKFAHDFFDGGGIPKAILTTDMKMTQEQSRTVKERLLSTLRGREPLVLSDGVKYQTVAVSPEESQFLATQQANVAQICRYFGVPAAMVDGPAGGGMQYSNTEQRGLEFLTYTLGHWLRRIEDAVSALLPNGQFVKFNTHSILRLDAETQSKVDLANVAMKKVAPSELRARDGLDPMTDAQKQEIEMVPLKVSGSGRVTGDVTPTANEAPVPAVENPTGA
jgi:HK97 family phage portal protein